MCVCAPVRHVDVYFVHEKEKKTDREKKREKNKARCQQCEGLPEARIS